MNKAENSKKYDLEERCLKFAKNVREYTKKLPRTTSNFEYTKQLIRSSGSVGANYIEANESLSRKDFFMRVRICRKEVKESEYWLSLTEPTDSDQDLRNDLVRESIELRKIFGAIVEKSRVAT